MIAHLDSSHYLSPLNAVNLGSSFTHIALIDFDGHRAPAYVKIDRQGHANLFNEALGYAACRLLNVPAPAYAAIVDVLPQQLLKLSNVPDWVKAYRGPLKAWVSEDMASDSLAQLFRSGADNTALWRAVLKSVSGAQIAALDEFLANGDRNDGNLLYLSSKRFAAIDHGWALSKPYWHRFGITDIDQSNIRRQAEELLAGKDLDNFLSAMTLSADRHFDCWKSLRNVIQALLPYAPPGDMKDEVIPFLEPRTARAWMAERLGQI